MQKIRKNSKDENLLPPIGFGTYPLKGDPCTQAVSEALRCGYRSIDTATYYDNFEAIAAALEGTSREDIYITSKVWHDSLSRENVKHDLQWTLERLRTSYLDAYLIHWPNSMIPIEETLSVMNDLRCDGFLRDIGLSNLSFGFELIGSL